jgi:phosphate-selective porin OprO/OprP
MRLSTLALTVIVAATAARAADDAAASSTRPLEVSSTELHVPPPGTPATTADAEARYRELLDAQRRLEERLAVTEALVARSARAAPPMGLGPDGFYLGSVASGFQLRLRGVVQADTRIYGEEGPPTFTDAFLIRRARLFIEGVVANFFDFRLLPDFAQGQLTLFEAWINVRPMEWLQARAGKLKSPFGLERLQAEQNIVFVERGLPSDLAPDRDIGIELHGDVAGGTATWNLAVLNGVPDSGSADVEPSSAKDVAARVFVYPLRWVGAEGLRRLGLGVAATLGHEQGSTSSPALASYRTTGQQVFFAYVGTAFANGTRRRLSPQGFWYHGPVGLLAEYVVSEQEVSRGSSRATLAHQSWQVLGSVLVTGDTASYDGVHPRRAFDLDRGHLGAVELAARYGEVRMDPAAFPVFADRTVSAQRARAFGGTVNWYFNRNVRLGASVERTTFVGGAAGGDRSPELYFFERLQVSF